MSPVEDRERADAVEAQKETWRPVRESLTFFKTCDVDFEAFDLPSWSIYDHFRDRCRETLDSGYEWLARQWADRYVESHINYMYNVDYKEMRRTMPQKDAIKKAEALQKDRIQAMKGKYP